MTTVPAAVSPGIRQAQDAEGAADGFNGDVEQGAAGRTTGSTVGSTVGRTAAASPKEGTSTSAMPKQQAASAGSGPGGAVVQQQQQPPPHVLWLLMCIKVGSVCGALCFIPLATSREPPRPRTVRLRSQVLVCGAAAFPLQFKSASDSTFSLLTSHHVNSYCCVLVLSLPCTVGDRMMFEMLNADG